MPVPVDGEVGLVGAGAETGAGIFEFIFPNPRTPSNVPEADRVECRQLVAPDARGFSDPINTLFGELSKKLTIGNDSFRSVKPSRQSLSSSYTPKSRSKRTRQFPFRSIPYDCTSSNSTHTFTADYTTTKSSTFTTAESSKST